MAFTGTAFSGSLFTIKELTGDQRIVELAGRGMPYRPYTLRGKQNTSFTWLPGNPIATVTVLGPTEDATDVKGMWKDKFIGGPETVAAQSDATNIASGLPTVSNVSSPITLNGQTINSVRAAIALMDDIRKSGQLLEVTWDVQIRHGLLTEFEQMWQNIHDCEWVMKFEWISQGDPAGAAAVVADMSAIDLQTQLLSQLSAATSAALPPDVPVSLSFLDTIQSSFQQLNTFVNAVGSATANLATLAMTPFQVARQCIAACANIISVVSNTIETIDDEATISYNMVIGAQGEGALVTNQNGFSSGGPGGAGSNVGTGIGGPGNGGLSIGLDGVGALTFNRPNALQNLSQVGQVAQTGRDLDLNRLAMTDRIQTYVYVRGIRSALYALRSAAIQGQATFNKQIQNTTQGVYTCKAGDDLRTISDTYYGTPFNWQLIALFNELEDFDLTAGQPLLIPFAPTGDS